MSDSADKESKTEQASEKHIQDSIEEGKIPVSREVTVLMSFAGLLAALIFFVPRDGRHLTVVLAKILDESGGVHLNTGGDAAFLLYEVGLEAGRFLLPVVLMLMVGGVLASVMQNPPLLILNRIFPTFSRISIFSGWQRLASVAGLMEFAKSVAKLLGAAFIVFVFMNERRSAIIEMSSIDVWAIPEFIVDILVRLLSMLCVALLVLVAGDIVWSRMRWRADLRMTRQQLKDEHKQSQGDPMVRARLRSLAQSRTRNRMLTAVPRATLVVANPTHFAVALYYKAEEGGAPRVLAKGQNHIALKIRATAEKHGVPVFEDKALARSLYAQVEVDQMIPPEFYRAVAKLVTYLNKKKEMKKGW